jgi:hypothetical protein
MLEYPRVRIVPRRLLFARCRMDVIAVDTYFYLGALEAVRFWVMRMENEVH